MQKFLVLLDLTDQEKEKFLSLAGENELLFSDPETLKKNIGDGSSLKDVDVIIGLPDPSLLKYAENLKWLQSESAGVDFYQAPGVLKKETVLTSAVGAYGQTVAEHLFAQMLSIMKRLPAYRDNQNALLWRDAGPAKTPDGAEVLILGPGDIGSRFAKYCKAFGAHTIGARRNASKAAEGIDEMHSFDEVDELLKTADVVCCILPHSAELVNFFNYDRFMKMKKDAIFLNAGRGTIVDAMGLYRALEEGQLFGVGLDTLNPEPFPSDHPLWTNKRVEITPHSAGGHHLDVTMRRIAEIALYNLEAYLNGTPMKNVMKH